ncbi:hypothetical protein B4125_3855 [Bacillus paralicheniformis]|uniref:Uncharacterized protein n=1 Tax=Bacillus paralicheniformis TaxID=1648923 RepID=A0A7Z0WWJ9_9BACI|nr:hypothetical protein SC10_B2orf00845 [Bacillus paralicheniformis]OLF90882.1 hypothetical protein B4121_3095 [Bacillus paralicheniformis]OLG01355.1 hypothetical protein B4125_3855 [Bacillus paralicheniformis]TWJ65742.1 hypothetical protein CHCC5022_3283 [Bacillus paralicheniformis]TWJ84665.1 hypothetical protein CHCC4186_2233 [Bacillus paralicheniformis]
MNKKQQSFLKKINFSKEKGLKTLAIHFHGVFKPIRPLRHVIYLMQKN